MEPPLTVLITPPMSTGAVKPTIRYAAFWPPGTVTVVPPVATTTGEEPWLDGAGVLDLGLVPSVEADHRPYRTG